MESLSTLFPTDNLYKFLAISGLVIFGFCFIYPDIRVSELRQKVAIASGNKKILSREQKSLIKDIDNITLEQKRLARIQAIQLHVLGRGSKKNEDTVDVIENLNTVAEEIRLLKNKNEREYFEFKIKYGDYIYPQQKELNENDILFEKMQKKSDSLAVKEINMATIDSTINLEIDRLDHINTVGFIGRFIGIAMSFTGFFFWYILHQKPQDELIKFQIDEHKQKLLENKKIIIP